MIDPPHKSVIASEAFEATIERYRESLEDLARLLNSCPRSMLKLLDSFTAFELEMITRNAEGIDLPVRIAAATIMMRRFISQFEPGQRKGLLYSLPAEYLRMLEAGSPEQQTAALADLIREMPRRGEVWPSCFGEREEPKSPSGR